MNIVEQTLIERFGENNVKTHLSTFENDFPLLEIKIEMRSEITVLMTNGLSEYAMPVPEKYKERKNVELYFCLPSYWDLTTENGKWVIEWIQKLAKHCIEKETWYGIGHTFPNGNPAMPISATMKQKYLMLNAPYFLEKELSPIQTEDKEINFLGIIPIFEDEMDYKMGKGTYKMLQKIEGKGVSELLDDYRMSCLKSKWRFFQK
jgi:hypothetical protein